jgi:tetratricopeptide (TPR) repeat protein
VRACCCCRRGQIRYAPIHPSVSQRADWPEHKRVCEEATEKLVRVLNVGQEAVRAGMLELQAAASPAQRALAYCHLGNAYHDLSDFRKAIEFQERHLAIAREAGDRTVEGKAYSNLGYSCNSLGDVRQAIEFQERGLALLLEVVDRAGEGRTCGNLGNAYTSLGEPGKAIEFQERSLTIARELGDRAGEGRAYGQLGHANNKLGDHGKALEFLSGAWRSRVRWVIKPARAGRSTNWAEPNLP